MPETRPSLTEIFLVALRLGCTSFGGPIAHLAYYRKEYVEKRRWLDEAHYADLVALCQFLPGPASSQTGFAIGCQQRGLAGGIAVWIGFTLPSALAMIAIAYGVAAFGNVAHAGWLHGLKVAAVAVVAQAVLAMWRSLCPDLPRSIMAVAAAGILLLLPATWSQIAVITCGGLMGWWWLKSDAAAPAVSPPPDRTGHAPAWLIIFFVLLFTLPVLARLIPNDWTAGADKFYRAGALVFGGGHTVLPMLEREVVVPGGPTHDQFLAGYGAAQAMPGPLFTFAVYLGTVQSTGPHRLLAGGWTLFWIFAPGLLLVLGVLPYWQKLRALPGAQSALRGANAAVVGVLLAALINPVARTGLASPWHAVLAVAAFAALQFLKVSPFIVVVACALLGLLLP